MKEMPCADKKKSYFLSSLSESRGQLYGVMTFLILFCHTFVRYDLIFGGSPMLFVPMEQLRNLAVAGVDMFLIMSGISLYFSFSADSKIKSFYAKRAIRLLPIVTIASFVWFAIVGADSLSAYLENAFLISFYTNGNRNFWFFAFLIVCYFFYPFIHKLFAKTGFIGFVGLAVISVSGNVLLMSFLPDFYYNIEVALIRVPSFLFGCWIGKYVKDKKCISAKWLIVAVAVLGMCAAVNFIDKSTTSTKFYYLCFPIAISSLILLSAFFSRFTIKSLNTVLIWWGGYSLEFYLLYEKVRDLSKSAIGTSDETLVVLYSFTFFVTLVIAIGLKALCNNLEKNLFRTKK